MYTILLAIHSLVRWLVLGSLLFALVRAYTGWYMGKKFSRFDNQVRHITATIAHVQLILGISLYIVSPIIRYFWENPGEGMRERQIRFFGMEHITMMLLGIIFITIGSAAAKRKPTAERQFKTMAIWYTIGLLVILSSVPWPFSPLVSRPWLRPF